MKTQSLSKKLILPYLLFGVFTVLAISIVFYFSFKNALIQRTSDQLASINILKKIQIEDYLQNPAIIKAISDNPVFHHVINASHSQSTDYTEESISETIKQLMHEHNFLNITLMNEHNSLIYSSDKEHSNIWHLFTEGVKNEPIQKFLRESRKKTTLIDVTVLSPKKIITILIGTPLFNPSGKIIGVLILQKDNHFVNHILQENTGLGNTGETYIVGEDLTMRSYSRFFPDVYPTAIKINTEATANVLAGTDGQDVITDYREEKVLSVYRKLKIGGIDWAIISEMDMQEAMTPIYRVRKLVIGIGIGIVFLVIIITISIAKRITVPILQLHKALLNLSKGILPPVKLEIKSQDEIGQITIALNELIEALRKTSYFAIEIGHGNLNAEYTPLSENDEFGNALIQMQNNLKKLNEEKLHYMKQRSITLIEGQEKERTRISRELHDGIGQMLTAIRLQLNFIETKPHQKDDLKKMLDETNMEIKRISQNLMPSLLIDFGLKSALNELIERTSEYAHVLIQYTYKEEGLKELNFEIAVSIYRVVQEAINNALKYAKSDLIEVAVKVAEKHIYVDIMDNGLGFDISAANEKKFNGIKNMQERVHLLGGEFNISSEINKGTRVHAVIPYF